MPVALPTCIIDGIWNVLRFADEVADGRRDDEHLERRGAAAADLAAERLRDDALAATPTA